MADIYFCSEMNFTRPMTNLTLEVHAPKYYPIAAYVHHTTLYPVWTAFSHTHNIAQILNYKRTEEKLGNPASVMVDP